MLSLSGDRAGESAEAGNPSEQGFWQAATTSDRDRSPQWECGLRPQPPLPTVKSIPRHWDSVLLALATFVMPINSLKLKKPEGEWAQRIEGVRRGREEGVQKARKERSCPETLQQAWSKGYHRCQMAEFKEKRQYRHEQKTPLSLQTMSANLCHHWSFKTV